MKDAKADVETCSFSMESSLETLCFFGAPYTFMIPHLWTVSLTFLHFSSSQADISADHINALLEATGNTEVEAFYPIIFANFLSDPEKLGALIAMPAAGGGGGDGGGGGGGGGGDAAEEEEKEEAKEEEVEMDLGGGMDMFGGEEGGGDY